MAGKIYRRTKNSWKTKPSDPIVVTSKNIHLIEHMSPSQLLRAYKVVDGDYTPVYWSVISDNHKQAKKNVYRVGTWLQEKDACTDWREPCSNGLHVATEQWVYSDWQYRVERGASGCCWSSSQRMTLPWSRATL